MNDSTPCQLRFPSIPGFTVRGDFTGGALPSDFGALLLRGTDQQTALIDRLARAILSTILCEFKNGQIGSHLAYGIWSPGQFHFLMI